MNRRVFVGMILSLVGTLTGCKGDQRPSATASITNNGEIQEALKYLAETIDSLSEDVSDFETENWQDVVPRVKNSASDVSTAFGKLKSVLGLDQ